MDAPDRAGEVTFVTGHGRPRDTAATVVYFAATVIPGGHMLVKIGSTTSLTNRLTQILQFDHIARRQRPVVVHIEVGGYERERERLAQFAEFNVTREWFTDAVLRDPSVASLGGPHEYAAAHPEIGTCVQGWAGHRSGGQHLHRLKLPTAEEMDQLRHLGVKLDYKSS